MTDNVIIRQYQRSPRILGIAQRIDELVTRQLIDPAKEIERNISVLNAEGFWLDRIGERFDIERPAIGAGEYAVFGFEGNGVGFDQGPFTPDTGGGTPIADDTYRRLILARGGQLLTDGSSPSLDNILNVAFGSGHYIDNQDLSVTVRIDGDFREDQLDLIVDTGLLTKPSGVRITDVIIVPNSGFFGFDGSGGVGFDQAPFVRSVTGV